MSIDASVDRAARRAAMAVHGRAKRIHDQNERYIEHGTIVRMKPTISVELFESALTLEVGDALMFSDQLRWWDTNFGLQVGDILAVVEMHDSTWLALSTITPRDQTAGLRSLKPAATRGKGDPPTALDNSSTTGILTASSTAVPAGGGTPTITVTWHRNIVKKMEVYDAAGVRIGWVPVFQDLP